jgi:hypothetical protein
VISPLTIEEERPQQNGNQGLAKVFRVLQWNPEPPVEIPETELMIKTDLEKIETKEPETLLLTIELEKATETKTVIRTQTEKGVKELQGTEGTKKETEYLLWTILAH